MRAGNSWFAALTAILILGVFGLFGALAVRHVGDSYFLGDQIDQLQNFERLLRLDPYGLWGGWMSGTNPPARALGPLTAVVFGVPVRLGFGPDGAQVVTSGLLVAGALLAFLALARLDLVLAWTWLLVFSASNLVWWSAGILWSNAVLLPLGCLLLAALVACLHAPSIARMLLVLLVLFFGLQAHLVALAAVPAIAVVLVGAWPQARRRPLQTAGAIALAVGAVLAVGPYLAAELQTGFTNTRRMLVHVSEVQAQEAAPGRGAFRQVLRIAADPAGILRQLGVPERRRVTIAGGVAGAALLACVWLSVRAARRNADADAPRALTWLVLAAIIGIVGQAGFFVLTNRSLLGFHYVEFLVPLYFIPLAALASAAARALPANASRGLSLALGAACIVLLAVRGSARADGAWEKTEWTYTHIAAGVATLCAPVGGVRTSEGEEFTSPTPGYDPVLKYLMTRHLVACRYDPSSDAMLVAQMNAAYVPSRSEADGEYRLVAVASPGLALYKRAE